MIGYLRSRPAVQVRVLPAYSVHKILLTQILSDVICIPTVNASGPQSAGHEGIKAILTVGLSYCKQPLSTH